MAWDAQQFAVLGAAALGAAGATYGGMRVAIRQARTQFRLAERATRASAYEETLRICAHLRDWANRTFPIIEEGGAPLPTLAPVDEQIRARVLLNLHGSRRVREAYAAFDAAMGAFFNEAREMSYDRDAGRPPDPRHYKSLEAHRQAVSATLTALEEAMRTDLDVSTTE